jgi:hypothetical protein
MSLFLLLLPAITGSLLLWWGLGSPRIIHAESLIILISGSLLGLAVSSCAFYLLRIICHLPAPVYAGVEAGLWILLLAAGRHYFLPGRPLAPKSPAPGFAHAAHGRLRLLIQLLFLLASALAMTRFALLSIRDPHGGIDAISIWNLHARFLYFGGPKNWQQIALLKYAQPDYPLLLPALIARIWSLLGSAQVAVPGIVAMLFSVATVALLVTTLLQFRGPLLALGAGTLLLGNPLFVEHGASQCADVPLSFFILATFVALTAFVTSSAHGAPARRYLLLAGVTSALAAWTKNEGIPFLVITFLVVILAALRAPPRTGTATPDLSHPAARRPPLSAGRGVAAFLLGALPILVIIVLFKIFHATPNSYSPAFQFSYMAHCMINPERYITIVRTVLERFWRIGLAGSLLAICVPLLSRMRPSTPALSSSIPDLALPVLRRAANTLLLVILGMMAVYFWIYLMTPQWFDLEWTIEVSCERLFLHLWPALLLGISLHPALFPWTGQRPASTAKRVSS